MDLGKFTLKSQEAIQSAQQIAVGHGQQAVDKGHLLQGILEVDENVAPFLLKKLGVNMGIFKKALNSITKGYPKVSGGDIHLSRSANTSIQKALSLSTKMKDDFASVEHLMLGLVEGNDDVSNLMKDNGITSKNLGAAIEELRNGENGIKSPLILSKNEKQSVGGFRISSQAGLMCSCENLNLCTVRENLNLCTVREKYPYRDSIFNINRSLCNFARYRVLF